MAYKMTKRGSLDNETTNEFICETPEDLAAIPASQINLGSVAVIIEPFEMLMAKGNKEWVSFGGMSSGGSSANSGATSSTVDQGQADYAVLQE